ncbi:MAG: hypothetical protein AAF974_01795, partial [Cyanobacteria bacterium P01_E01_bin.34]
AARHGGLLIVVRAELDVPTTIDDSSDVALVTFLRQGKTIPLYGPSAHLSCRYMGYRYIFLTKCHAY